uniref:Uncharacterized protein n=1 Tax=Oryza glumipatula TaxID=40148 RepID=A0A0D9ZPP8_9ORYZ
MGLGLWPTPQAHKTPWPLATAHRAVVLSYNVLLRKKKPTSAQLCGGRVGGSRRPPEIMDSFSSPSSAGSTASTEHLMEQIKAQLAQAYAQEFLEAIMCHRVCSSFLLREIFATQTQFTKVEREDLGKHKDGRVTRLHWDGEICSEP